MESVIDGLLDVWKTVFNESESLNLYNVKKSDNPNKITYSFSFFLKTQRGKESMLYVFLRAINNQLCISYSDVKTKELLLKQSELVDQIVEHIDLLDSRLQMLSTFGKIEYPYSYLNKEAREKKKKRPSGVKKEDIQNKKVQILAFYQKLKTLDLPKGRMDPDERRVFQLGGIGSKFLAEYLKDLGIAKETGIWGSYNTVRFYPDDYQSDLYQIMDEWKEFIQNEIGLEKCYVHSWYMD